jgi:signal transduction histidine kinase
LSSAFILGKYNNSEYAEKKEKHINRIKNAVEGMKGILEDFLSLGKLEEGKIPVNIVESEPKECIDELQSAVTEMEHLLKKGQQIIFHQSLQRQSIYTDTHILKSIFINLVSNAIKFSEEDSEIEIILSLSKTACRLSVKDSGIGIPESDQVHLFDRFFRAGNAANIQGSGLGLHIIGKYLELLHGTITIESIVNKGSTFLVNLPQPDTIHQ